jgi:hypothetical protein
VLTVTADSKMRPYSRSNPQPLTGELDGKWNGDDITPVFETSARDNTPVGRYNIIPWFKDPNNRLFNYRVITNIGTLTITQALLTVTAHDKKRVYGNSNPKLDGDVTGLREVGGLKGFFGRATRGDNIAVSYQVAADASSEVGTYTISPVFSDLENRLGNYLVVTNTGKLTITPARLTVVIHDVKCEQGQIIPQLSGDVGGLRPGDNISVSYRTGADEKSPLGHYAILPEFQDPRKKLVNYFVVTNGGTLTIIAPRH